MKNLFKLTILLVLCLFAKLVTAQTTFKYTYDDAGNRETRTIITLKSATIKNEGENKNSETDFIVKETDKEVYQSKLGEATINIYPNPTKGMLKLTFDNTDDFANAELVLYDLQGGIISSQKGIDTSNVIDLSSQPQGTYILSISMNGNVREYKIIKE